MIDQHEYFLHFLLDLIRLLGRRRKNPIAQVKAHCILALVTDQLGQVQVHSACRGTRLA